LSTNEGLGPRSGVEKRKRYRRKNYEPVQGVLRHATQRRRKCEDEGGNPLEGAVNRRSCPCRKRLLFNPSDRGSRGANLTDLKGKVEGFRLSKKRGTNRETKEKGGVPPLSTRRFKKLLRKIKVGCTLQLGQDGRPELSAKGKGRRGGNKITYLTGEGPLSTGVFSATKGKEKRAQQKTRDIKRGASPGIKKRKRDGETDQQPGPKLLTCPHDALNGRKTGRQTG